MAIYYFKKIMRSGQTRDYNISIRWFSAKQAVYRNKIKEYAY